MSGKTWFYIDDQGLQQGPFKPRKLQKWYSRGLLPSTLLLTQTPEDPDSFVSLLELTQSTADQTFTTRTATTKSLTAKPLRFCLELTSPPHAP